MIKQLAQRLFANKFLLIAVSISIVILFIVLIITSSNRSATSNNPRKVSVSLDTSPLSGFTNLSEEKLKNASDYRHLISDRLPIYLADYPTSVGINTTISISIHPTEPSLTRLDITGLSYLNKDELSPTNNPNIVAFAETFNQAMSLLRESGIDPKQLLFHYGEADYVRVTATYWVEKLGLLR